MQYKQKYHWGPYLWSFIHTISIYNGSNILEYNIHVKNILESIAYIIPCQTCVNTYKDFLITLEDKDLSKHMVLFYWSVDLHNLVNSKLNKRQLSYSDALLLWTTRESN
jgi:hypothetical protein